MTRLIIVVAVAAVLLTALDLFGLRYGYSSIEGYTFGFAAVAVGAALALVALTWLLRYPLRRRPDLYGDEEPLRSDDAE